MAIETAPASKLDRMRALGATLVLVSYEGAWKALDDRAYPGVEGTFIHPFDDDDFIAGHATMGLEILEDAPDAAAVICGVGGGGLITGVGSAVKALKPDIKLWAAEPETAAPAVALVGRRIAAEVPGMAGLLRRRRRRPERLPAHVGADDAAGGRLDRRHPGPDAAGHAADGREGAHHRRGRGLPAAGGGAHRQGGQTGPIVCVVSGGNVDITTFCEIMAATAS